MDNIVTSFRVDVSRLQVRLGYYSLGLNLLRMMCSPLAEDQVVAGDHFFCFVGRIVDVVKVGDGTCID